MDIFALSIATDIERHPLEPFLPRGAKILLLGSFPPPKRRWSMNFFYPNYSNDMWRIMGVLFFGRADHFILAGRKKFDYDAVVDFCRTEGIALFDTASAVRRLRENASDKFLEVVEPTDLEALLDRVPECRAVATTGERATETLAAKYGCVKPAVGAKTEIMIGGRKLDFWRMPSSSRAYPLPLERKAAEYAKLFGHKTDSLNIQHN